MGREQAREGPVVLHRQPRHRRVRLCPPRIGEYKQCHLHSHHRNTAAHIRTNWVSLQPSTQNRHQKPPQQTHSIELCNSARRWRQHPPRQRGVHAQGWHSVQLQPCGRAHTHAHGLHNGTSLTVVDSRSTRHTGTYPRGAHWDRIHSGQVARWWLPRRCRPSSRVYTRPRGRLPGMPSMPGR